MKWGDESSFYLRFEAVTTPGEACLSDTITGVPRTPEDYTLAGLCWSCVYFLGRGADRRGVPCEGGYITQDFNIFLISTGFSELDFLLPLPELSHYLVAFAMKKSYLLGCY